MLLLDMIARGNQAVALARSKKTGRELKRDFGIETRLIDLETAGTPEYAAALEGCDAVVFSAGAGPGSGPARKQSVDLGAALKTIEAAQLAGVRRYVQVSAMNVDKPVAADADESWIAYVAAKRESDAAVRASGLDWTIIRPGRLIDAYGTGRVALGERLPAGEIPRADVAGVLTAVLEMPATIGREWDVTSGDSGPRKAIRALLG